VEPKMLDTMFPASKTLLQRHGAAQVEELVVKQSPVIAVRRRGKDLRGLKCIGERQHRERVAEDDDAAASLTGEATGNSLQLSIATWNAGASRGFRIQENFRKCNFHVLLSPEFENSKQDQGHAKARPKPSRFRKPENAKQVQALDRMGFTSFTRGYQLVAVNTSSVATLLEKGYCVGKTYEALFAEVSFKQAHSGLTRLMVGSLHLDHVESKKPVTIAEALIEWAQMAEQLQVDVVGCSWNSGRQVLEKIMACQKGGMIIYTPHSDCTGFLVPAWSKLLQDAMPAPRCSYFNVPVTDLGSGTGDADSHWMVAAHWRRYASLRQRSSAALASRTKTRPGRRPRPRVRPWRLPCGK
jgi:hypothetical protein